MNPENYGSLEACERLFKTGIVLETDTWWVKAKSGWRVEPANFSCPYKHIPAPSMSEAWRELPFQTYIKMLDEGSSLAWICDEEKEIKSPEMWSANPTDALIDLLVWVRKEAP